MTAKSRTIDNLGLDASIRYARDKELFEPLFIEEAQIVSQKTQISVARPYIPSEFDRLFSSEKTLIWASFSPPPNYFSYAKPLFSYQLIPSLGTYEQQDENKDKLEMIEEALQKQKNNKQRQSSQDSSDQAKQDKERQEEEKEKQLISSLLACISKLDKSLALVNSRRNQYQRG